VPRGLRPLAAAFSRRRVWPTSAPAASIAASAAQVLPGGPALLAGPQAPAAVTAVPGNATATVSWTGPASLDTGTLTGYTATAIPGGSSCTTASATSCTITGLTNGTAYTVTVVAHTSVGDSGASGPVTVTPADGPDFTSGPAYTASFGVAFSFTVTATGSPAPKITRTGQLPSGVKFTRDGNGTASLSGTCAARKLDHGVELRSGLRS
jgi:hypothetical protein